MSTVSMVVALGKDNVIGKDNGLLWHLSDDLKHFKAVTIGHPVIMGRNTWESIPEKFRPLPGRTNIVVSRSETYDALGAVHARSLDDALEQAKLAEGAEEIFIIGGGQLYAAALPQTDRIYLTLVHDDAKGTVFFPDYSDFTEVISEEAHEENGIKYIWRTITRP
ncbi:MAG: dihydrofolate reductase [Parcubacteria group bacterium]|nr:dihydrofolate reductase [Parcubacteria group bacterium]